MSLEGRLPTAFFLSVLYQFLIMCAVMFDYYEYSATGEYLGENTDFVEFRTRQEAEDFLTSLSSDSAVKKAWFA